MDEDEKINVKIWFDYKNHKDKKMSAKGVPTDVVRGLDKVIDQFAKDTLSQFYAGGTPPKYFPIAPGHACYISGTTTDLRTVLQGDINNGINSLYINSGKLAVWYIRRAVEQHVETIICIAARGVGNDCYWKMKDDQHPFDLGRPASQWKEALVKVRPQEPKLLEDDGKRLPLQGLVDKVLPLGKAEPPWYPEVFKRIWGWKEASGRLRKLCQENTKMDKHLRSDESHSDLYVHDDSMHSLKSADEKYAEGVNLIKAALSLDRGPDVVDWVFSNMGFRKDKNGLTLKQINLLLHEVDNVPDALRFRYPGLRMESGHGGQLFTQYYSDIFYILVTMERESAGDGEDQSKWQYTGDKVHVSVNRDQVKDAWNLIVPILVDHHHTTKEFKVTDMALRPGDEKFRGDEERFLRVMNAFQINIYLHAAPGDEHDATRGFAKVMDLVTDSLKKAGIEGTSKLTLKSDLPIDNKYLSFCHDIDDLLDSGMFPKKGTEVSYRDNAYIKDLSAGYLAHREQMRNRPLYKALLENQR